MISNNISEYFDAYCDVKKILGNKRSIADISRT